MQFSAEGTPLFAWSILYLEGGNSSVLLFRSKGSTKNDRQNRPTRTRTSGTSSEKYAPEQSASEGARANDGHQRDVTAANFNVLDKQPNSPQRDSRDIASLLAIIAALTRELESKNEYIESNVRKVAALSDALERALGFESLWARSCIAECVAAIGIALFGFCLYRAVLC